MVRVKFTCTAVEPNGSTEPDQTGSTVHLLPVVGGSLENEEFYKLTPGGQITLSTVNEAAAGYFEVGKNFYVDFHAEVPLTVAPLH
jgi:hypothetical protein